MSIEKLLLASDGVSGGVPEGVSFDGVSDYLSRASDLVGNIDSKTFTFSFWVYYTGDSGYLYGHNAPSYSGVYIQASGDILLDFYNSSGVRLLRTNTSPDIPNNTWTHYLISVDLSNVSNRRLYINDTLNSGSWIDYVNDSIDFTTTELYIGNSFALEDYLKGRLSHLYLDYTYRDLSIEANRRLFVTDDLKPASGQESLNPILYLPMTDKDSAGTNLGTGGDFTVNGVLDTAQRGANQDNCVASEFDGSTGDVLGRGTLVGSSDGGQFVLSCSAAASTSMSGQSEIISTSNGSTDYFRVSFNPSGGSARIEVFGGTSALTTILYGYTDYILPLGVEAGISLSVDLSNTGNRFILINNIEVPVTWSTYVNGSIDFTQSNVNVGGRAYGGAASFNGSIGELYFDTTYIDLSADNPFWNSDTSKPKPIRQVLEETGNTPLIAMPISADNPGLNLGTGGDFTLNGGGLIGARGASEYIARSALIGSVSDSLVGSSVSSSSFTCCVAFRVENVGERILEGTTGNYFIVDNFNSMAFSSPGFSFDITTNRVVYNEWIKLLLSLDNNGSVIDCYMASESNPDFISVGISNKSGSHTVVGSSIATNGNDIEASHYYLSDQYIDFSQEENRLLFVGQLGYPKDLAPVIEAGDIPTPIIYMPFDDTSDLGKNLGTGGDFTINGTVTAGADFKI